MSSTIETEPDQNGEVPRRKRGVPEGLWIPCDSCKNTVFRKQVEKNLYLCPDCQHHFTVPGRIRIQQVLDEDSFEEWFTELGPKDPLGFVDSKPYKDRLIAEQKKSGLKEACIAGRGYMRAARWKRRLGLSCRWSFSAALAGEHGCTKAFSR
jgi:acetyl-CoA carboxylase carboxyl transferase subunit beta